MRIQQARVVALFVRGGLRWDCCGCVSCMCTYLDVKRRIFATKRLAAEESVDQSKKQVKTNTGTVMYYTERGGQRGGLRLASKCFITSPGCSRWLRGWPQPASEILLACQGPSQAVMVATTLQKAGATSRLAEVKNRRRRLSFFLSNGEDLKYCF